jgi:predicted metal-dependent phosphoesterase TrpH
VIDLQIHTTDSDGTWAWDKALNHCLDINLKAFAITDHDTIVRRDDIIAWGKENDAMAIPGIELSTSENDQTVHLLGYFLDGPLDRLRSRLEFLKEGRLSRNKKMIARLRQLGIDVSEEDVFRVAGTGVVGRPHIARLLLEKKVVGSIQEAFEKYLSLHGLAYFPKEELPLKEAIELLRSSGAVTSVAHPGLLKRTPQEMEESVKVWRDWGLDGLEGIYPTYSLEQTAFYQRLSDKYGFLLTGGSDFHGENKPHIKIGTGTGHLNVPDELMEPLLSRRAEIRKNLKVV